MNDLASVFLSGIFGGGLTTVLSDLGFVLILFTLAYRDRAPKGSVELFVFVWYFLAKVFSFLLLSGLLNLSPMVDSGRLGMSVIQLVIGLTLVVVAARWLGWLKIKLPEVRPLSILHKRIPELASLLGLISIFNSPRLVDAAFEIASTGSVVSVLLLSVIFIFAAVVLLGALVFALYQVRVATLKRFPRIAGWGILAAGIWSINGFLFAMASPIAIQNIWQGIYCTISFCS